jgi:hypothetical protein
MRSSIRRARLLELDLNEWQLKVILWRICLIVGCDLKDDIALVVWNRLPRNLLNELAEPVSTN